VGLFKKVVIADTLAVHANAGFDLLTAGNTLSFASAWIAVLAFSFQLYYDFSGYSDMAVGLARLFGIRFPANFHSPYKSTGIIEFWRRWHITLSRFLRDYLYIPLGGNRRGPLLRYVNLAVVMLLGGLWHGANWTFVAWGAVHGGLLAINHAWNSLRISSWAFLRSGPARAVFVMLTFFAVTLAWVPFRAENIGDAGRILAAMFPLGQESPSAWASFHPFARLRPAIYLLLGVGVATFLLPNTYQIFARFNPVLNLSETQLYHRAALRRLDWKAALVLSGMFVFSVLQLSRVSPFLYFQF
jgi:D-alanyl-lipoteichoic acid acyltransferase DltB (MBOAT superfamily)